MSKQTHDHDLDINDLGLVADLAMWQQKPLARRRMLRLGVAGAAAALATYGLANSRRANAISRAVRNAATDACLTAIPSETAGPYPADGSTASGQMLNVLTRSGIVRKDIRPSLSTGNVAAGVPTTIELELVSTEGDCGPLVGYAVYAWHCSREGLYSMYSAGVTAEDYCRGVQVSDASGKLSFTSIFPACYSGRWPHVHFEVYPSLATATSAGNVIHTSQLALPEDVCNAVYNTATGYSASRTNLSRVTLASDNVFRDGSSLQMATVTGSVTGGYAVSLKVGVAAATNAYTNKSYLPLVFKN
jgi:protocatechuate 3,4-dioxygenase beta subunit